jgi:hypothetical protein
MTKAELNRLMPEEFWRQVVDRVALEASDTLLLAEAFWLLEGYFVRTLGMHRVYNSAFMNMLKDEDNAKYRSVIKNTLEFNPEVLKRFVNFMSNPDEETALFQFGKGDKYFGICTMMATMPGLPMFGHGQIEGFAEKYGMEYRYAKWDEQPDWDLVRRHEREIFPLMKRRHLFAEVKNFLLYDFFTPEGYVNEDVFAYSNRAGEERALVIYHNKYESARGWVRTSVAFSTKASERDDRKLVQKNLGEGLGLHADEAYFCIFRDHVTGLEYIRNSKELCDKGLYVELGAYKYHVFVDFREVRDNQWQQYAQIANYLNGRGVPHVEDILKEILLQPIQQAFKELVNGGTFHRLMEARVTRSDGFPDQALMDELEQKVSNLLREAKRLSGGIEDEMAVAREMRPKLEAILHLPTLARHFPWLGPKGDKTVAGYLQEKLNDSPLTWGILWSWLFVHALGKVVGQTDFMELSRSWIDEWRLGNTIASVLRDLGLGEEAAWRSVTLIKLLTGHQRWFEEKVPHKLLESLLKDHEVHQFLQVNRYNDILWFNKEAFDDLLWWLMALAAVEISSDPQRPANQAAKDMEDFNGTIQKLKEATRKSGYQVEKLLEILR